MTNKQRVTNTYPNAYARKSSALGQWVINTGLPLKADIGYGDTARQAWKAAEPKATVRYTVEAGRMIARDGEALFTIRPQAGMTFREADNLVHHLARFLNDTQPDLTTR